MKKKKMKNLFLAMSMILSLVLCGCGNSGGKTSNASSQSKTGTQAVDNSQTEAATSQAALSDSVSAGGHPWIDSDLKANIQKDMPLSLKDDFHLYVNHDWLLNHNIAPGRGSINSFTETSDDITSKAIEVLKDKSLKSHDAALAQNLYQSILDWDKRNSDGLTPIMNTVQDIQSIDSMEALHDFICNPERSLQVNHFLRIGNDTSKDDSSKYATHISTDAFTLRDAAEYKKRTELGENRYQASLFMAKAMLSRLDYTEEQIQTMFDRMIDLETKIAEVAYSSADKMDPDYDKKTNNHYSPDQLSDLSKVYPLKDMIDGYGYSNADDFVVGEPQAIERINELFTEENLEAIKDYMLIHYVNGCASCLDKEAYDVSIKASNMISGSEGSEEDEKIAFYMVRNTLYTPLDKAYLEKYDCSETKQRISDIIQELIVSYREMLNEETWLSEETRAKAIEKLDHIRINSVYPEKWTDYSSLNLDGLSYKECLDAIALFDLEKDKSHTNQKVDKDIWSFSILDTNAYYEPSDNSINILLGILSRPFYSEDMTKEELLGGIGSVIGHEISHAFDTAGSQYDKDGNMKDWWQPEDYKAFQKRADKLVAYYNGITVWEGQPVFGKNIQTEAIADMGGIKAVLNSVKGTKDFDYGAFFKAYASLWRGITSRKLEYIYLTQDSHPLMYLRTNVTLQQYDEFFNAFDIKEGDGMYLSPDDRINVW